MKATLTRGTGIRYRLDAENGAIYWSETGEKRSAFIERVKKSLRGTLEEKIEVKECTEFNEACYHAMNEIDYINAKGLVDSERKAALQKIVEVIDLYNAGEYEAIANLK
jgi:hypothetical protein